MAANAQTDIPPATSARLDALRAFLLLQVVLGHLAAMDLPELPHLSAEPATFHAFVLLYRLTTRFGPQAAYLFVLLSGFFVGGALLKGLAQGVRPTIRTFLSRRLRRIVPALVVALLLSAAFDLIGVYVFGAAGIYAAQHYDFVAALTWPRFVGNLLCLQPTLAGTFGSNGPLWTLGYIVQFYFAGFFVLRLAFAHGVGLAAMLPPLALAAWLRPEWACLFLVWGVGAALRRVPPAPKFAWPLLIFGIVVFVAANRAPVLASILLCGAAGAAIVQGLRGMATDLGVPLRLIGSALAGVGYEAYAIHYPVAFFLFAVFFRAKAQTVPSFLGFVLLSGLCVAVATLTVRGLTVWSGKVFSRAAWA